MLPGWCRHHFLSPTTWPRLSLSNQNVHPTTPIHLRKAKQLTCPRGLTMETLDPMMFPMATLHMLPWPKERVQALRFVGISPVKDLKMVEPLRRYSLVCKLWVSWLGHSGFSWFVISNCFISTTNCEHRKVCLQPPVRMVRWCWIWRMGLASRECIPGIPGLSAVRIVWFYKILPPPPENQHDNIWNATMNEDVPVIIVSPI